MTIKNETVSKLFIQELVKLNSLKLCTSFVLIDEITADSDINKVENILEFIQSCSNGVYVSNAKVDIIKQSVIEIMSTGVKEKDAVHVACAILANCDYFISVDKRLLKFKSDKIKLINPIEFVRVWEEMNEQI
jgi:predicted nucleic acid-binding protein